MELYEIFLGLGFMLFGLLLVFLIELIVYGVGTFFKKILEMLFRKNP